MKNSKLSILLSISLLGLVGCGSSSSASTPATTTASATAEATSETVSSDVMSYAEYASAAVDSEVTVETYVQAKQGWWENNG